MYGSTKMSDAWILAFFFFLNQRPRSFVYNFANDGGSRLNDFKMIINYV